MRFGSYLQWDDVAYPVMLKVKSVSNGLEGVVDVEREHWLSPALAEVGSLRVKTEWYEEFTTACGKAGSFRDIEKLRLSINPRVLGIEAKTTTMGVQRMIERILSGGMTKEERLIDGIRSEAEGLNALAAHGTFVTYNWFIRVARKA